MPVLTIAGPALTAELTWNPYGRAAGWYRPAPGRVAYLYTRYLTRPDHALAPLTVGGVPCLGGLSARRRLGRHSQYYVFATRLGATLPETP